MTDPKPTTNDILSKIRGAAAKPADSPVAEGASAKPSEGKPAREVSADASAQEKPSGTADILAAARSKAPATGSSSTADILAAARAKASAAPGGPADIMAAIRGGSAAAAGAAKPATAVPQKAADKMVPAGLSPAEMIRKAREGSAAGGQPTAPGKVALPSRPLPGKVAAGAAAESRRGFLSQVVAALCTPIVIAWVSFTTAATASALAVARFMMPNVLVEPPTKFKIGPPNDYAPGTVSTKWQAQFGVWIVNAEVDGNQQIYALSTVCTHLGCTPNWLEGEQKFKCPCHGSGFYKSGVNFEGPAPRPLERFGLRLAEDGMLEVDKGLKFQKELGQWSNPSCFVPVA